MTLTEAPSSISPDAPQSAKPVVVMRGVSKVFSNGTLALTNMSLTVQRGEFLSLLGPSGCGKSTALRIIAGLSAPSAGVIEWPAGAAKIGFVFQEPTLLPWADVEANVQLPLRLAHADDTQAGAAARQAIEHVGLADFANAFPRELSGGMKMRASLARSLVLNPSVFLFDEPFGAVDEITRERLNDEVTKLFQLEGFAGLFITHSISEAVFLSTRVLVMSARPGRVVADFTVPFDYPRAPELRFEPAFAELAGKISHELRGAHS